MPTATSCLELVRVIVSPDLMLKPYRRMRTMAKLELGAIGHDKPIKGTHAQPMRRPLESYGLCRNPGSGDRSTERIPSKLIAPVWPRFMPSNRRFRKPLRARQRPNDASETAAGTHTARFEEFQQRGVARTETSIACDDAKRLQESLQRAYAATSLSDAERDAVIELRHDLHREPELSNTEWKSLERIGAILRPFGLNMLPAVFY